MAGLGSLFSNWTVEFNENGNTLIVLPATSYSGLLLERIFFRACNLDTTTYILLHEFTDSNMRLLKENELGYTEDDGVYKTKLNALYKRFSGLNDKVKMLKWGSMVNTLDELHGELFNLMFRRGGIVGFNVEDVQISNMMFIDDVKHVLSLERKTTVETNLIRVRENIDLEDLGVNLLGLKVGYEDGDVKIDVKDLVKGDLERRGGFNFNRSEPTLQDDLNIVNGLFTIYNQWVSKNPIKYNQMKIDALNQTIKRSNSNENN